jgi:hypothetical protein
VATTPSAFPSVVVEQQARRRLEHARNAVVPLAELVVAAEHFAVAGELDEAADEQIQPAVVVVIEPHGARRPARCGDTGLVRHVGESSVAIVLIQDAAAVRRHEQVRKTVIVVITDGNAHPERAAGDTSRIGHVRECAVAVVPVERIFQRPFRFEEIARTAVDEIDVHPAVVVEVEERAPGADGLRQIPVRRHRVLVAPCDPALRCRHLFEQRARRFRRSGGPTCPPPYKRRHACDRSKS